ncbi:MAG TPA: hypothetical protein VHX20_05435 [Terracidiphilus sp.]|jgi:DNA-binding PadR family transcriptional regulator|nr:hypothetical protein [Terracidiphilus sp.]
MRSRFSAGAWRAAEIHLRRNPWTPAKVYRIPARGRRALKKARDMVDELHHALHEELHETHPRVRRENRSKNGRRG